MMFFHIKKSRFILTLFILLIDLQISACSNDNRVSAATGNADQNNQTINETNTNNTTTSSDIGNGTTIKNDKPNNDSLIINSIEGTTHAIIIQGIDKNTAASNITLSWVAPAEREDNSPLSLSAIAGYNIYYGTTPGQYPNSTSINDGSATGYIFNNFISATYYFAVTTIDTDGRESLYSTEIIRSI